MDENGSTTKTMPTLEARGLAYEYRRGQEVWSDVSLALPAGCVAFLTGKNGSGKSTLLRCLAGWAQPSRGKVLIGGREFRPSDRRLRSLTAFAPDVPAFYDDLTAREHIEFVFGATNMPEAETHAFDLAERFGISFAMDLFPSGFSRGMRQKLALALAIAANPRLLLLDEPLSPLDAESAHEVSCALNDAARKGMAVLASIHRDASSLAPDIVFELKEGMLLRRTEGES